MKLRYKLLILCISAAFAACSTKATQVTSPGGVLNVTNGSGEAVELYVDGARVVTLSAGERQTVARIISGTRKVKAVGVETKGSSSRTFDLKVGEPVAWQIERFAGVDAAGNQVAPQCSIDILNETTETVSVTIGDRAPTQIAAGVKTRIGGLDIGTAVIQAISQETGIVRAAEIPLRPDVVPMFTIMDGAGAVRFTNRSGRDAFISPEGAPAMQVANGKSFTFRDLKSGRLKFTAVDIGRRLLGVFDIEVRKGEVLDLAVNQPAGVLNVVSDIPYPVSIFADGVQLGICPAKGGASFQGLVIGNNNLKAVGDGSMVVAQTWLEIKGDNNLWLISESSGTKIKAGTGVIEVENPSREKLDLYVDGNSSGGIEPGARRVVPDLVPGKHAAAVIGSVSKSLVTATVAVRDGQKARWKVAMPVATLTITNSASEDVNVYSDGRLAGTVKAGATSAVQVTQGEHAIEITGALTRNGIARTMVFPAGTSTAIAYSGPMVTVVATNFFPDPVEIRINQRLLGVLKPNERLTVSDVQPGTLRLSADSTERPVNMTVLIDLSAGEAFDWNINQ